MVLKQILCLLHLINHPVRPEHMVATALFTPVWWPTESKTLEHVLKRTAAPPPGDDTCIASGLVRTSSVRDVSVDAYCNFATGGENGSSTLAAVPFAKIICAPVVASYRDAKGNHANKCFWTVALIPIRAYDVGGHLRTYLQHLRMAKRDTQLGIEMEEVYSLWQDVIRYQLSKSPSATRYYQNHPEATVDPMLGLLEHGTPYSLVGICNVFEFYRSVVARSVAAGKTNFRPPLPSVCTFHTPLPPTVLVRQILGHLFHPYALFTLHCHRQCHP
jgi:hypothetical protein